MASDGMNTKRPVKRPVNGQKSFFDAIQVSFAIHVIVNDAMMSPLKHSQHGNHQYRMPKDMPLRRLNSSSNSSSTSEGTWLRLAQIVFKWAISHVSTWLTKYIFLVITLEKAREQKKKILRRSGVRRELNLKYQQKLHADSGISSVHDTSSSGPETCSELDRQSYAGHHHQHSNYIDGEIHLSDDTEWVFFMRSNLVEQKQKLDVQTLL